MAAPIAAADRLRVYRRFFHELDQQLLQVDGNPATLLMLQAEIRALEELIMLFAQLSSAGPASEAKQTLAFGPWIADLPAPPVEGLDISLVADVLVLSATAPWTLFVAERSQWQLCYVSPSCKRMLGWLPSDLIGSSAWASCHPDDASTIRQVLQEPGTAKTCVAYRRRKKDSEYAPVQAAGRAVGARWYAWVEHDLTPSEDQTSSTSQPGFAPTSSSFPTKVGPVKLVDGDSQQSSSDTSAAQGGVSCATALGDRSQASKPLDATSSNIAYADKNLPQDLCADGAGPASRYGIINPSSLAASTRQQRTSRVWNTKPEVVECLFGKKVLLAEDDMVNRKIGQMLLESQGCKVTLACNGKEALDILQNSPEQDIDSLSGAKDLPAKFDLVLMDLNMPVMDGTRTVEAVREWEAEQEPVRKPLVIFAVTANVSDGDMVKCARSGFDEFVSKPLTVEKLKDRLGGMQKSTPKRGLL